MQKKKKDKNMRYVKIIIIGAIVAVAVWFLVYPLLKFRENKNQMLAGAENYVERNGDVLPKEGEVRTIGLSTLYQQKYVDTLYVPYTHDFCSTKDSWVKITNVDGEYKYHVYLKCGVYSSIVDHKGPEITLNGKEEIVINKGDKYKDAGVKSVNDNEDGKIDVAKVKTENKVDTSKVGTYKVKYTVKDSLENETVKERTVKVIQKLSETVKEDTNNSGVYTGRGNNNYIMFSGMLFRVVKVNDDETVRIVSDNPLAYVDYNSADEWLNKYFYDHIAEKSKKYIAKGKFCSDQTTSGSKKCNNYKEANVGLISVDEFNNSFADGDSYLLSSSIIWLGNASSKSNAWTTKDSFNEGYFKDYSKKDSNGINPVINLIKGTEVKSGDGSLENPYRIGDYESVRKSTKVNKLTVGEYISYGGYTWRFIEKNSDGSSKIVMTTGLIKNQLPITRTYEKKQNRVYNPKEAGNIGYIINQGLGDYISTKDFVNQTIKVPIYSDKATYSGKKTEKEYKVRLAAPDMHELFSGREDGNSYWLRNSSKNADRIYVVSDTGSVYNTVYYDKKDFGIKLVAHLKKSATVADGSGTVQDPYTINK